MKIKNSTVLVTGANRGIGRSLVEALLAKGAGRIYATARKIKDLEPVVAINPDRVIPLKLDVTDPNQIKAGVEQARDINILINNAGALTFGSLLDCPLEMVMKDMNTNFFGALNMTRSFSPVIEKKSGGAIINILTIVALSSMPGLGSYNASKAAAWSMTQSFRADLAKKGIRVHSVFPGPVDTDMIKKVNMPKTSPAEVAKIILEGVESDLEDIFPDPMAKEIYAAWCKDHKAIERQFGAM